MQEEQEEARTRVEKAAESRTGAVGADRGVGVGVGTAEIGAVRAAKRVVRAGPWTGTATATTVTLTVTVTASVLMPMPMGWLGEISATITITVTVRGVPM